MVVSTPCLIAFPMGNSASRAWHKDEMKVVAYLEVPIARAHRAPLLSIAHCLGVGDYQLEEWSAYEGQVFQHFHTETYHTAN